MDIAQEVLDLIERHLPKATGELLQKRLASVDALEKENIRLAGLNDSARKELGGLRATSFQVNDQKEANNEKAKELFQREASVAKREDECKHAEIRIEAAKSAKSDIMELCKIVFRNPRFVTSECGQVPFANAGGYTVTGHQTKTVTSEQE